VGVLDDDVVCNIVGRWDMESLFFNVNDGLVEMGIFDGFVDVCFMENADLDGILVGCLVDEISFLVVGPNVVDSVQSVQVIGNIFFTLGMIHVLSGFAFTKEQLITSVRVVVESIHELFDEGDFDGYGL
jgi:hypothetical protein